MNASYLPNPIASDEVYRLPPEDWDLLFGAVLARLRNTVARSAVDSDVCSIVIECVDTLEQLRQLHPSVVPYVR